MPLQTLWVPLKNESAVGVTVSQMSYLSYIIISWCSDLQPLKIPLKGSLLCYLVNNVFQTKLSFFEKKIGTAISSTFCRFQPLKIFRSLSVPFFRLTASRKQTLLLNQCPSKNLQQLSCLVTCYYISQTLNLCSIKFSTFVSLTWISHKIVAP